MSNTRALPVPVSDYGEIDRYQVEIQRFPLLSEKEEYDLAVRYRDSQDLEAAHRLVASHLRYVVKIAREYANYGLRQMDLIQEGSIGLMQAVKRFEPDRGFRLSTYAGWWIRAAIQEFILRSWSLVKIGTTAAQRKLFFSLRKSKRTIERLDEQEAASLGRQLGVKPEEVLEMDARMSGRDDSLNRQAMDSGDEVQNLLADPRDNQEIRLLEHESRTLRHQAVRSALDGLDPREREIVTRRILADASATLDELGQEMGVSRERIRQLEKRALEKLRKTLAQCVDDLAPIPGRHDLVPLPA